MGDGRAEGSSAIGDGGQAALSLMPDVDGTHIRIFESSQLEGSYIRDLLYFAVPEDVCPGASRAAQGARSQACLRLKLILLKCGNQPSPSSETSL